MHSTLPCAKVGPGIAHGKYECRYLSVWNDTHQMQIYIQVFTILVPELYRRPRPRNRTRRTRSPRSQHSRCSR